MPTLEETLQEVPYAKVFSQLDLSMAFHQIELHPDSRDITTFAAPNGLHRYNLLLFWHKHGDRKVPANCRAGE